jgi:hypothetical protein
MDKWYKKKKFWISVVSALAAAGVLSPAYSETAMKVLQAILGG